MLQYVEDIGMQASVDGDGNAGHFDIGSSALLAAKDSLAALRTA